MRSGLDHYAIAQAKARARGDLLRAVAGMPADEPAAPEPEQPRTPSFDGGARMTPPIAESHEETLLRIIRERSGDVGASFGA
jgi:hypothetical protein